RWAFMIMLRLPGSVRPVFEERLQTLVPLRAGKVLHAVEDVRGGRRNDARFGERMRGQGPRWAA
ncbi:MAG: radical SAM protein, partial [Myxococcales bacterium]|nr:radical SAM protein [Myxococcales bacterium]